MINILSIGPGDISLLNEKTMRMLCGSSKLILRTGNHPIKAYLESRHIPFLTMDKFYETSADFEELFISIAQRLWKLASEFHNINYVVSDFVSDKSIDFLFQARPEDGEISIVPGFSYADYYLSSCRGMIPTANIRICTADDFIDTPYDPSLPVLITELNNNIMAGEVKNRLSCFLDDESTIFFFRKDTEFQKIPLFELDRQSFYSHMSAVSVGPYAYRNRNSKTMNDLVDIMDLLRSPEGCSWDRVQTHETLKPYVVEEAWEVVDAIEEKDTDHLAEELGDLLFQIVFHASLARSFDEFTITDVITSVCNKMIRRHPHVFSDVDSGRKTTPEAWDQIKAAEGGYKTLYEALLHISEGLPSLRYAEKVIRKISQVSQDTASSTEMIEAASETLAELKEVRTENADEVIGRLLFMITRISFSLGIDSEILLHHTTKKVIEAYRTVENTEKTDM